MKQVTIRMGEVRTKILFLFEVCGQLAYTASSPEHYTVDPKPNDMFITIIQLATLCRVDLRLAVLAKLELNRKKYPVELTTMSENKMDGNIPKYTEFSEVTGYDKNNQSIILSRGEDIILESEQDGWVLNGTHFRNEFVSVRNEIFTFAEERDFIKGDKPRNLFLAMMGELGELAELVQWKTDHLTQVDVNLIDCIAQEIADVLIYFVRFAEACGFIWNKEVNAYSV